MGIHIPSIAEVLLNNIIEPFFLWELLSFILWILIHYYSYAIAVGTIYLIMLIVNIKNDFRNRNDLIKNHKISTVRVLREGSFKILPEHEVLPGDLVYIDNSNNFTCDVEILKGDVITDESFLTGESVPICKGPGLMVYSGTKVIKSTLASVSLNNVHMEKLVKVKNFVRAPTTAPLEQYSASTSLDNVAIGMVIKTGKRTRRGTMLRNLFVKKPSSNEFKQKSIIAIKWLVWSAVINGWIYPLLFYNFEY